MRAFLISLILGTLGATPRAVNDTTHKLEELQKTYTAGDKRMYAVISELRDIKTAFPSSPDPAILMRRWENLKRESDSIRAQQDKIHTTYRDLLRGYYVYQATRFMTAIDQEKERSSTGGDIFAYEKTITEMETAGIRFKEDFQNEQAQFHALARRHASTMASRRTTFIIGAYSLGAAGLLSGVFLVRRRKNAVPAPTAPAALPVPQPAPGPFELRGLIGRGTMGEVYEAFDAKRGRRLALKILRPELLADPARLEPLLAEARAVSALSHPNIAALHSIERAGAQVYFAFEFIEGETLQRIIETRGPLDWVTALFVLKETASALHYTHAEGVTHRDLKPANIMLTRWSKVKVLDFAVAHEARKALAGRNWAAAGATPPYMAPEQEQGKVSPAVDLFALSVTFYEMLTGALPFKGPNFQAQKLETPHRPPRDLAKDLPTGLDAFFKIALAPEPSRRFTTAEALAAAAERTA